MGPNDLAANGFAVVVNSVEKDPSGGGIALKIKIVGRRKERKALSLILKYAIAVVWFIK